MTHTTPRPWKVAPREYAIDVRDQHDNLVCHISKDFDRANADAALIVKAVNTLDEAKAALNECENELLRRKASPITCKALRDVRAVLAKLEACQ